MYSKKVKITLWIIQIAVAVFILQTLRFKFTGHADSIAIFSALGVEPWGRIGTGIVELIAGIALLIPRFSVYGALLTGFVMIGAIFAHLVTLGFDSLAWFAVVILVLSLVVVWIRKKELPFVK